MLRRLAKYWPLIIIAVVMYLGATYLDQRAWNLFALGSITLLLLAGIVKHFVRARKLKHAVFVKGEVMAISKVDDREYNRDEVFVTFISPTDNNPYQVSFVVNADHFKAKEGMLLEVWVNESDPASSVVPNATGYEQYSWLFKLFWLVVVLLLMLLTCCTIIGR